MKKLAVLALVSILIPTSANACDLLKPIFNFFYPPQKVYRQTSYQADPVIRTPTSETPNNSPWKQFKQKPYPKPKEQVARIKPVDKVEEKPNAVIRNWVPRRGTETDPKNPVTDERTTTEPVK